MAKITDPVKISLTMHGVTHTVDGMPWDSDAEELIDAFKRLLIGATFSPSILDDEYGHYEYIEDNKIDDGFQPMKVTEEDFNKFNDSDWYGKKHDDPLLDGPTC